jgi:tetratricopeptide (TPR) repeat protein
MREETIVAEFQAECAETSATSERLAAELLTLREKSRSQARREEVSLSMSKLECRQLEFELQAAKSKAQLDVSDARAAMQEEFERERMQFVESVAQVTVPSSTANATQVVPKVQSLETSQEKSSPTAQVPETSQGKSSLEDVETQAINNASANSSTPATCASPDATQQGSPPAAGSSSGRPPLPPNSPSRTTSMCNPDRKGNAVSSNDGHSTSPDAEHPEAEHKVASDSAKKEASRQKAPGREAKSNEMLGRDLFRRAEALCAQQRHEEAIPIFEEVLQVLRERSGESIDRRSLVVAQADVWAHLGVSMQSLDRMHEALASYGRAVALNPQLHACFANLATLHLYLRNTETARRHIGRALAVKPTEEAYLEIQKEVEDQARRRSRSPEGTARPEHSIAD